MKYPTSGCARAVVIFAALLVPAVSVRAESVESRARACARAGDAVGACVAYQELADQQPLTWKQRGDWGTVLVWAGRYGEAVTQLEEALAQSAKPAPAALLRARAIAVAGAGDGARALELASRDVEPALPAAEARESLIEVARLVEGDAMAVGLSGDWEQARALNLGVRALRCRWTRPKASVDATTLDRAVRLAKAQQYEEAFAVYTELEVAGKLDWRASADWGIALEWAERYAEAAGRLDVANELAPKPVPEYIPRALAVALAHAGDVDRGWELTKKYLLPRKADEAVRADLASIADRLDEQADLATDPARSAELRERAQVARPVGVVASRKSGVTDHAVALAKEGQFDEALAELADLEAQGKLDARGLADWGIVLNWAGWHAEALGKLDRSMDEGPQPVPAYVRRAWLTALAGSGRLDEAWDLVNEELLPHASDPEVRETLRVISLSYFETGSALAGESAGTHSEVGLARARRLLEQAGMLWAEDPRYTAELGRAQLWSGLYEEAAATLSTLSPSSEGDSFILACLGEAEEGLGRREQAIDAYRRALQLNPFDDQAQGGLVRVADAIAEEALEGARHAEALASTGNTTDARPLFDSAITTLERAIELAPDMPRLRADLGIVLNWDGRFEEAIGPLETALALSDEPALPWVAEDVPPYAYIFGAYAEALEGAGRGEEAARIVEMLRASSPPPPLGDTALAGPGRSAAAEGLEHARVATEGLTPETADPVEKAAALACFDRALQLAPRVWQVLTDVGIGENWLGLRAEAREHLLLARDLAPAPTPDYLQDALLRSWCGDDWDEGLGEYDRVVAADPVAAPQFAGARDALVQCGVDRVLRDWDSGVSQELLLQRMRSLQRRAPENPQTMIDLGVLLVEAGTAASPPDPLLLTEARGYLEDGLALRDASEAPYALAALAGAQAGLGDRENALASTEQLEALQPDHPAIPRLRESIAEMYSDEGTALARSGKLDEGIALIGRGLDIAPDSWRVRGDLGVAFLWEGDPAKAQALLEDAIARSEGQAPSWLNRALGDAYVAQGLPRQAEAAYRAALESDPSDPHIRDALDSIPRALGERAMRAAWAGDLPGARQACDDAIAAYPQDPWPRVYAGVVASWQGRNEESVALLTEWLPKLPVAPVLGYSALSDAFLALNQPESACDVWERLPLDYPDAATAAEIRSRIAGGVCEKANDLGRSTATVARAEALLKRAAAMAPTDPRPITDLAVLQMRMERFEEAEQTLHLAETVAGSPNGYITRSLGDLLAVTDKPEESMGYYDRALAMNPDDWSAQLGKVRLLAWTKRSKEALAILDGYLAKDPADLRAITARAYVLAIADRHGEALKEYDRAIALAPTDDGLKVGKAVALRWSGKHDDAWDLIQDVLSRNPDDIDALTQLVGIALDAHRPKQADEAYDKLAAVLERDSPTLERRRWLLRPYRDPSLQFEYSQSIDTDRASVLLAGATLRVPVTPTFELTLRDRMRWFREPNVASTEWNALGVGVDWRVSPKLRLSGSVDWNNVRNVGNYRPVTYEARADISASDKLDFRLGYRHSLLTATRTLIDRTSGHEGFLGTTIRPNQKTRWDIDWSQMWVSDGNRRSWTSLAWSRQTKREGTKWASWAVEARRMTNTQPSARYWSPTEYDVLMARYSFGRDDREKDLWWGVGLGAGVAWDSEAGFGVPLSVSASLRKRVGDDGQLEAGLGVTTAGTERTSPGRSSWAGAWWYASYRHFF